MKQILISVLLAFLVIAAHPADTSAAGPTLTTPDGSPVAWDSWLEEHGPAAVVLWASWSPGADDVVGDWQTLEDAASTAGVELVLVSAQESVEDARRGLGTGDVSWLHDRYGSLLKHHRVVRIPAMVVVAPDGEVLARLEPTARALEGWKAE